MNNLVKSDQPRDFYVWINPNDFLVRWNIEVTGTFSSVLEESNRVKVNPDTSDNLMFLPNPQFNNFISPFQSNLVRAYSAEYNFEMARRTHFPGYPSRLDAVFLLETEDEALKYRQGNIAHVGDRELRKVGTVGEYCYSIHDSSWVEFCRQPHSMDAETINSVSRAYWSGEKVRDSPLMSMGKTWTRNPIIEVLYLGMVRFYDRTFNDHQPLTDMIPAPPKHEQDGNGETS